MVWWNDNALLLIYLYVLSIKFKHSDSIDCEIIISADKVEKNLKDKRIENDDMKKYKKLNDLI